MTDDTDLDSNGKPRFRLADAEDIANMSTAFTLPGRLAKQLADRQKFREQQQARDLHHKIPKTRKTLLLPSLERGL